ncbi:vacuolar protein sorting-associated protein 37A-like [Limulus polyphemus]|uniref:Vacuolar protein sorting-associated protein 37A-like n=1 Tax=Limulus polyphemus TaxID=6850 RepID=A0ABM1BKH9_LIMPO|nr:vacuolar protein sorting-associated protein 37A-like [Limulus polyphemus]
MSYHINEVNPDYMAVSSLLQDTNTEELKRLLSEDQELNKIVRNLQQVKNIEAEREILLASNKSLAEFNLNQEPVLLKAREGLSQVYLEAMDLKKEVEENKQKYDEMSKQESLDTVLAILQTSAAQSEEETEKMADDLKRGDLLVEDFIEKFMEKRKVTHLLRVKAEKMAELLSKKRNMTFNEKMENQIRIPVCACICHFAE